MSDFVSRPCFSSETLMQKPKNSSFFTVPGLFIRFTTKVSSDSDSANSPTSPLDSRVFSNLGNQIKSPKPSLDVLNNQSKIWDCKRVGLGIVDSLNDYSDHGGKFLGFPESKKIVFGSRLMVHHSFCSSPATPQSLPKNYAISPSILINGSNPHLGFSESVLGSTLTRSDSERIRKFQSCLSESGRLGLPELGIMLPNQKPDSSESRPDPANPQVGFPQLTIETKNLDEPPSKISSSLPVSFGSGHGIFGSLSAREIELSEDYTCVISHGPNPKTTHIFGDCIVAIESPHPVNSSSNSKAYPSTDFLSFCYACKKKLGDGKDIYMYRGEKAFCSCNCRSQEILIEEELGKSKTSSSHSFKPAPGEEIFSTDMAIST